jgi:hypothetical protein
LIRSQVLLFYLGKSRLFAFALGKFLGTKFSLLQSENLLFLLTAVFCFCSNSSSLTGVTGARSLSGFESLRKVFGIPLYPHECSFSLSSSLMIKRFFKFSWLSKTLLFDFSPGV